MAWSKTRIAAALVAWFCVCFAYQWWHRDRNAGPTETAAAIELPPVAAPAAERTPVRPAGLAFPPTAAGASPPLAPREDGRPRRLAPLPAPSAEPEDAGEMPVVVGFVHKTDIFRDSSTDYETQRRVVNEGIVSTADDKPLTITVIDTDVPTQESSQATFVLPKGGEKHFGMHDGLTMASGDQLTLRSPPYRDRVQQIP